MITSLKTGPRSLSPAILNVFPTFATGGSQVRFLALANSLAHDFRQLVFAVDGRYDCFDRLPQILALIVATSIFLVAAPRQISLPPTRRSVAWILLCS